MRLLLQLAHSSNARLSFDYPHHISSWIYRTLYRVDSSFAEWLHEQGFSYGTRKYKLFTFGVCVRRAFLYSKNLLIAPEWN